MAMEILLTMGPCGGGFHVSLCASWGATGSTLRYSRYLMLNCTVCGDPAAAADD